MDLSKGTVTGTSEEPERVMKEKLQPNFVFSGMNMFMPDTVKVRPGSVLTWFNNSDLPHNVVGVYISMLIVTTITITTHLALRLHHHALFQYQ